MNPQDDDSISPDGGTGDDAFSAETEEDKKKRRQDRHRTLERRRRERTQELLNQIQSEIERQTGRRQPGASTFTLNKALAHVVNHVRRVREQTDRKDGAQDPDSALDLSSLGLSETKAPEDPAATEDMELLKAAVMACESPIAFVCMDGGIIETNFSFGDMLGYSTEELCGNTLYMHSVPEDMAHLMSAVCDLITHKSTQVERQIRLLHRQGHHVECKLDMFGNKAKDKVYILVYATEINPSASRQQILHVSLENGKVNNKSSGRQAITNAQIQSDLYQHGHYFPSGNAHHPQIAAHPMPSAHEVKPQADSANPIPNVFHHAPAIGSEGWRSDRPQGLSGLNQHFPQPVLNQQASMAVD
eukprot:756092-Hanusia_phi.AAC.4